MAKIEIPSLLSFSRSQNPTDAVMLSVHSDGDRPIDIQTKTVNGTESQFSTSPKATPNIQTVDFAAMPHNTAVLAIVFSVDFTGETAAPQSCDNYEWREALRQFRENYIALDGFRTIGRMIAANIANARWAWSNRINAMYRGMKVMVSATISDPEGETARHFTFDARKFRLDDFTTALENSDVQALGDIIAAGLRGGCTVRLAVRGEFTVGEGSRIYPSQEFVAKAKKSAKDDEHELSKVLFGISHMGAARCAAMHEQKIGNALRTIDIWHNGFVGVLAGKPLPVNPYAQDRDVAVVVRHSTQGRSLDFYGLLVERVAATGGVISTITSDDHFIMANLIRGGVFGKKSDEKAEKEKAAKEKKAAKDGRKGKKTEADAELVQEGAE